jgi:TonB family protein
MAADWANLEGHTIRGVFPLLRLLGSSERSAVFLSRAATIASSDIAVKVVPAIPGEAEPLLPRWQSATALDHPHLLRLFEAGEFELGEQRYLYSVMEYAEQNLAQLLEHRALGPDEVREMLGPTLNALEFLHGSKRVHGGLKPSNVLVVGEQVKLASDTIGPASDVVTAADDVWSLGVMTCEALSRRRPAGLHAVAGSIVLPPDIPATFSEMISKCLSRKPEDRPDVARLQAWQKGGELGKAPSPASMRLVIRAEIMPPDEIAEPVELKAQWRPGRLIIAAVVLLAIVGVGIYFLVPGEKQPEANGPVAAAPVAAEAPRAEAAPAPATEPPATEAPPPVPAASTTASDSPSAINEVIPVVPRSASQTIRGTIRVSVRVIVDDDGNVMAATAEDPGPSRYFERLSLDAAKKWTFAPAETGDKRLMRVKFNYTRSGTTAKASPTE